MRRPYLFDGRNLYHGDRKRRSGFHYYGIGIGADDGERS